MADEHFYHIVIESTITMMELIQKRQLNVQLSRMIDDDDIVLFTFQRRMPNGINTFVQNKVRPSPYLAMDLQALFVDFFQVLNYQI